MEHEPNNTHVPKVHADEMIRKTMMRGVSESLVAGSSLT